MATPNKGYATPVTGTGAGTWGSTLNDDVFGVMDNNLGGIVTKTVAGSNITLTSDEAQNAIIRLTGAQSADIQLTNPCIGFYFVENLTTNSFNITVTNGVSGVVVPKGRSTVIADETNGCRIAGTDSFPTGTRMSFQQTNAPTGWTKDSATSNSDAAIRLTTGTVSTGGSLAFSTSFTARTPSVSVNGTALSISQLPEHFFWIAVNNDVGQSGDPTSSTSVGFQGYNSGSTYAYKLQRSGATPSVGRTNALGDGSTHTHNATSALDLSVKYVDFIIAVKN